MAFGAWSAWVAVRGMGGRLGSDMLGVGSGHPPAATGNVHVRPPISEVLRPRCR